MAKVSVEEFARQVGEALQGRLVALLLYGSTARGTHVPGRSDVNTLLVCDAADETLFALLEPAVRAWTRGGNPAPLILTEGEWRASSDAFPIEYEEMRQDHRVLAGRDPWPGIVVRREDVRRQLEYELLSKLVRLRQAYAALWSEPKRLGALVLGSVAGFLTMLRSVLRLSGRAAVGAPDAVVRDAAALIGFSPDAVTHIVAHARGEPGRRRGFGPHDPLLQAYLAAVARTTEFVNRLT